MFLALIKVNALLRHHATVAKVVMNLRSELLYLNIVHKLNEAIFFLKKK